MRSCLLSGRIMQGLVLVLTVVMLWGCRVENDLSHTTQWHELEQLKAPSGGVEVTVSGPRQGTVDQNVHYTVRSSESGYLWLIQVDSSDQVSLLFPNELEQDQYLSANRSRSIPGSGYDFTLSAPRGTQQLAFIVTGQQDDLVNLLPDTIVQALLVGGSSGLKSKGVKLDWQGRWGMYRHYLEVE